MEKELRMTTSEVGELISSKNFEHYKNRRSNVEDDVCSAPECLVLKFKVRIARNLAIQTAIHSNVLLN